MTYLRAGAAWLLLCGLLLVSLPASPVPHYSATDIAMVRIASLVAAQLAVQGGVTVGGGAVVSGPSSTVNVVFVGDSWTFGYTFPGGAQQAQNYPVQTVALLNPPQIGGTVNNMGVSGQAVGPSGTVGTMLNLAASTIDTLLIAGKKNILVLIGGANDAKVGTDAVTLTSYLSSYWSARKTATWNKVIAVTLPAVNWPGTQAAWCFAEATRVGGTAANASTHCPTCPGTPCICPGGGCGVGTGEVGVNQRMITLGVNAATGYDRLVDLASIASFQDFTNSTYYQSDGQHWTVTGGNAVAAAQIASAINAL